MNNLLLLLSILTIKPILAAPENSLVCKVNHLAFKSGCILDEKEISNTPKYDGERYEADFRVKYSFDCKGHQPNFGLISGRSFARFELGAKEEVIEIRGQESPKTYDPKPADTEELSFNPECQIVVHEVASEPSTSALILWVKDAKAQAKVINKAVATYTLATDFTNFATWEKSRSESLLKSVRQKKEYFEKKCKESKDQEACSAETHFNAVEIALTAKLEQKPASLDGDDLEKSAAKLKEVYTNSLKDEVTAGMKIAAKLKHFKQEAEEALNEALEKVPEGVKP